MSAAREHFSIDRSAEYFSVSELQSQTGHSLCEFAFVVFKELVDNALDAAESANRWPHVAIDWQAADGFLDIMISDNGLGIPADVIERILDFGTRTSDKAAYVAPTRGQQGNALKTLLGIPIALGGQGHVVEICAHEKCHAINLSVTPAGAVEHTREVTASPRTLGTWVRVSIPYAIGLNWEPEDWVRGISLFNPHATIRIRGVVEYESDVHQGESRNAEVDDLSPDLAFKRRSADGWNKFLPTDASSAAWYSQH